MAKYSQEFKLEVIKYVLEGNSGCDYAAKKFNIPSATSVKKWVNRYKEHGVEGIFRSYSKIDGNFKLEVIEYMHKNHLSLQETANKFRVAGAEVIGRWERIYYEEGPQALYEERRGRSRNMDSKPRKKKLSKETEEDLIAEVQRLRMENDYLKKLNALVQDKEKLKKKIK